MPRPLVIVLVVGALGLGFVGGSLVTWHPATAQDAAAAAAIYACPMHPAYRSNHPGNCPTCGMALEKVHEDRAGESPAPPRADAARLVHVSAERQQTIGVKLGVAERGMGQAMVRAAGRVAPDETRVYRITAATSGWIEQAMPNTVGSLVRKDETLATYYAREFLSAQQAYFYALDARDRFTAQKASDAQMASTRVQIQQAADSLRSIGMSASQLAELEQTRQKTYHIALRAPAPGFILERKISEGQRFEEGFEMYVIADLRKVWLLADLSEGDRPIVRPGATVPFKYGGRTYEAKVSHVLPQFDEAARTLRVRLEFENAEFLLRPGMFVDVEFPVTLPAAVTVPSEAVVDSGMRRTVFVDRGNGYFEPRHVETGWRMGDRVQILSGLEAGERIVISGTFLLDSEARMRAAAAGAVAPETDPVCGMDVDREKAVQAQRTATAQGRTYYFCSDQCRKDFEKDPGRYGR